MKHPLLGQGFKLITFLLSSSCQGITSFTWIWISELNHCAPICSHYSGDLAEVTKNSTLATGNITQSLNIQYSRCATRTTSSFFLWMSSMNSWEMKNGLLLSIFIECGRKRNRLGIFFQYILYLFLKKYEALVSRWAACTLPYIFRKKWALFTEEILRRFF